MMRKKFKSVRPMIRPWRSAMLMVGLLALGLMSLSVRSSARDFTKVGLPITSPVKLYGVTSVYDRIPSTYEAWAVGERVDPTTGNPLNQGVLLYFNGTSWTNVPVASGTPALTSVSGQRYLTSTDECYQGYPSYSPWRWQSSAWAVGKQGTILKLDPYTNAWNAEKKVDVPVCVGGTNNGILCDTTANITACGAVGYRTAESFEGEAANAPLLHVEYVPPSVPNAAPTVSAGLDQTITLPTNTVTLDGAASDDGLPSPTLTYSWSKVSGSDPVTFGSATDDDTSVTLPAVAGTYVFRLTVSDDGSLSAYDEVQITVQPEPSPTVFEKRVAASSDDAEESASGSMRLTSSDLEITHDSNDAVGVYQKVGLRFASVNVPQGATITKAYVQFTVDNAPSNLDGSLTIKGQASNDALPFGATPNKVSSRPLTTASVTSWSPSPWTVAGQAGLNEQTPELKTVIQEIVGISGWASNNALAIIITGTGRRMAESFDGIAAKAPLLHVEYLPPSVPNAAPTVSAGLDQTITLPTNTVTLDGAASDDGLPSPTLTYSWSKVSGSDPVTFGSATDDDTSVTLPAVAGTYVFRLTVSDDGSLSAYDEVQITVQPEPSPPVINTRVAIGTDDAEESVSGGVDLASNNLQLAYNAGNQTVGMRFGSVTIPVGSAITNAYIQFKADETQSVIPTLTIQGQAADNAATFLSSNNDVSSRPRTSAITWSPPAWDAGEAGGNQRTPDLTSVIQEIVSRAGWGSGNALAIIITSTAASTGGTCQSVARGCTTAELQKPSVCVGGTNSGTACPNGNECTGGTCTNVCANWTSIDFNAVAAPGQSQAIAVGTGNGSTRPLFSYQETLVKDNAASTCTNKYLRQHDWAVTNDGDFGTSDIVRAAYFIDKDHGWLAGANGANGKVWKYSLQNGYEVVSKTEFNGQPFTSVAATFHSSIAAGQPLRSLVWLGSELNTILRYDEAVNSVTSFTTGAPVRSLALSRRAGGQGVNLAVNQSFEADRRDAGVAGRYADGWQSSGSYTNALGNGAATSLLDTNGVFGQAYVGEPWQSISGNKSEATGIGLFVTGSFVFGGLNSSAFPQDLYGHDLSSLPPYNYPTSFTGSDLTQSILDEAGLSANVLDENDFLRQPPYEIGTFLTGYLEIPDNATSARTYEFEVEQTGAAPARVAFNVENDTDNRRCESAGSQNGLSCSTATDLASCTSDSGKCVDRTSFPYQTGQAEATSSAVTWKGGTCQNSTLTSTSASCFDDSECFAGTCSNNAYRRCTKDSQCPRVCTNFTLFQCTSEADCRRCTSNQNYTCTGDADCPRQCTNPEAAGNDCFSDSDCGGVLGSCPSEQTNVCPTVGPGLCPVTSCALWPTTAGNPGGLCQGESNAGTMSLTPAGAAASPQTVKVDAVTFPASGGIKAKQCSNSNTPCMTDAQCGSGTCQLKGNGWYPFALQLFQPWTPRCSNDPYKPCVKDADCSGGFCQLGKWCVGGPTTNKACFNDGDCSGGSCQYAPGAPQSLFSAASPSPTYRGTCNGGTNNTKACRQSSPDCPGGGTCVVTTDPPTTLKLKYSVQGSGTWTDVSGSNLMSPVQNLPVSEVAQEIPLTQIPGTAYRVSGKYKVTFTDQFDRYSYADPRWNKRPHAGLMTRCKNSSGNNCGYEVNLFQSDRLNGVGSGTCQGSAVSCTTNQSCVNQSAGTICEGDWVDFSAVVTKRNYSFNGSSVLNDAGQTLEVVCFADIGAKIACDNITVTSESEAAVAAYDVIDVWAVGDQTVDGATVYRNTLNIQGGVPVTDTWLPQQPPAAAGLRSITSTDPHHFWAVGDQLIPGRAAILRLNPGNVAGWGWIGTSTNQNDPIGWIDFNCGNQGSCASQPSSFGVNVSDSEQFGQCADNLSRSCKVAADCGGAACAKGVISGSAWLGSQDTGETVDYGPCTSPFPGRCAKRYCIANTTVACTTNTICQKWCEDSHQPCASNVQCNTGESCVANNTPTDTCPTAATCSSDSQCTGAGNECRFNDSCNTQLGQCYGNSARLCSGTSQCSGTCSANQGIRCIKQSDCKISCSQNPLACRSSGWLSFDKKVTGTPPASSNFDATQAFTARFDSVTGAINGWGRLQLGQCTVSKLACFQDSDCGSVGACSYVNAPGGGSDQDAGWVRLRGESVAGDGISMQCLACTNGATPSDGTCKICSSYLQGDTTPTPRACNTCSSCVLKRCPVSGNPCTDSNQCGSAQCQAFGFCGVNDIAGGTICFSDAECDAGGGSRCIIGAQCTACTSCSAYGVSLDQYATKQLSGFAYSRDLGWIDFSRASLGGRVFLQTRFGDVYSGGDIGSVTTAPAPSFPTGPACNATYRLVAAQTITNFCTSAGTNFLEPGSQVYPLPRAANRYTAEIGELDVTGLTTKVGTTNRNKYGDVVDPQGAVGIDTNLSAIFGCSDSTCSVVLNGSVYHIKGNLIIDKDTTLAVPAAATGSGAGTFVVDGNLTIQANVVYGRAGALANRRQLPSAAFIVKGDITIDSAVAQIVGAYYTEKTIATNSSEPDVQLAASGVMVAERFNFQRQFSGGLSGQEPAEVITYDGRLQANTPPGLTALAQGLPNLQEVVP